MTTQLSRRPSTLIRHAGARLGRRAAFLIAAVSGLLASVTTVPAFAQPKPMGDGADTSVTTAPFAQVTSTGGMPGWQIALIAIGAALAAAAIAIVVDRKLAARRHPASVAS
jgi:hypothetical protein